MISKLILFLVTTTVTPFLLASPAKITDGVVPVGSVKAIKGGTFYRVFPIEPQKLNPITSTDLYATYIKEYVMDMPMIRNPETHKYEPSLAESMTLAKDGMAVTLKLRKGAKWHDGKPVTVKDVKFSFDAIVNGKFDTAAQRPYYENIESATILNDSEVTFKFRKKYFGNQNNIAGMWIVPMHVYKDPKKKLNKTIVGSGAYKLHKYKKGKSIQLKKNKDWWGWKVGNYKKAFNPEKIMITFVKEDNVQLEMLKKGQTDFLEMTPEQYHKKAVGKLWGKKVHKKKVKHSGPKSYGYIGWNLQNDLFKDRKVRVALAHSMNRRLMIKKFRYGASLPATGPWYQQSPFASKKVKPYEFDLGKARKLFKQAGWKDTNKDGILDKVIKGKKTDFKMTLMFPNKDTEKYYTVFKEDLKKVGVQLNLKIIEWNSLLKAMDEKKFDAVALGWGGGAIENDPKQIWHTESSKNKGSNFISYSNPKVDKLIDDGRQVLDFNKRVKMWQEIYETIAYDAPYLFMFNDEYNFYGVTDRIGMEKPAYAYEIGHHYWWLKK